MQGQQGMQMCFRQGQSESTVGIWESCHRFAVTQLQMQHATFNNAAAYNDSNTQKDAQVILCMENR